MTATVAVAFGGIATLLGCPEAFARRELPGSQQVERGRLELPSTPFVPAVAGVGTVRLIPKGPPVPRPAAGLTTGCCLATVRTAAGSALTSRRHLQCQPEQAGQNDTQHRQSLGSSFHAQDIGRFPVMRSGKSKPLVPILRFCQGRKLPYFPAQLNKPRRRDFRRPQAGASLANVTFAAVPVASAPGFLRINRLRTRRRGVGERSRSFGRILAHATRLSPPPSRRETGKCHICSGSSRCRSWLPDASHARPAKGCPCPRAVGTGQQQATYSTSATATGGEARVCS